MRKLSFPKTQQGIASSVIEQFASNRDPVFHQLNHLRHQAASMKTHYHTVLLYLFSYLMMECDRAASQNQQRDCSCLVKIYVTYYSLIVHVLKIYLRATKL